MALVCPLRWTFVVALLLVFAGPSAAAPRIYHSQPDDGVQHAYPLVVPAGGATVLHLYMDDASGSAVPSPSDACEAGIGDERCGWSAVVEVSGGVALTGFVASGDTVWGLQPGVFRANGGVVDVGEIGAVKLGDLSIESTSAGTVVLRKGTVLDASLSRQPLAEETILYVPEPGLGLGLVAGGLLISMLGRPRRRRAGRRRRVVIAAVASAALATQAAATVVPFATPVELPLAGSGTRSVTGADLDGDGDLDLAVALYISDEIYWLANTDGAGTFGAKQSIDTGVDGAWMVLAADVDRDGDMDLIVAAQNEDKVAWYENTDGAGTFGAQQVITTAADFVVGIFVVDLDMDGDLDVLSASQNDNKIAWYENTDGAGTFGAQQVIGTSLDLEQGVSAGDIDGDGDIDVISGALVGTTVGWFENDPGDTGAKGTFGAKQVISTLATGAFSLSAVDLDQDGDVDVISASYGDDELAWYENTDGAGTFGPQQVVSTSGDSPRAHVAVDVDWDGDLDLVVASEGDNTVAWYEHLDGAGTFGPEQVLASGQNGVASLFAGDLDGDGDIDIVSAAPSIHRVTWYENRMIHRTAALIDHHPINTTGLATRTATADDLDGDGDLDVVFGMVSNYTVGWHENTDGAGTFDPTPRIIASGSGVVHGPYCVETGDLDGDGDVDVLSASNSDDKIAWYENIDGAGTFGAQQVITTAADGANGVHAADLDGDGDLDVLSSSFGDDKIAWYENTDGAGTFGAQQVITTAADAVQMATAADLDGDGDLDVLSTSSIDNKIAWYENTDGAGTFGAQQVITTGVIFPETARPVDLDRDGDLDLVAGSYLNDEIVWLENTDGAGTFGPPQVITNYYPVYVWGIDPVDMNGDGQIDLLASSAASSGLIQMYLYRDDLGAIYHYPYSAPLLIDSPRSVEAADLDGDGDRDALYTSWGDGEVAWFENVTSQTATWTGSLPGTYAYFRLEGETQPFLGLGVQHNGVSGDEPAELAHFDLLLEEAPGDPLTTAEVNAFIATLKVYRDDDRSGYLDAGDSEVASVSPLSLTNGVQRVTLTDGHPSAQISVSSLYSSGMFFLVAELAPDPSAVTPHVFIASIVPGSTASEYAINDEPLTLGYENLYPTQPILALSLARDEDGDGLTNDEFNVYGTDPLNPDSDSDGVSDGDEVNVHATNPLNGDSDGDGLSDGDEVNVYGTDPLADADLDGDGISDADEVLVYGTDPTLDADADGDGLNDAAEILSGTNPNAADTDGDGVVDGSDNCPSAYNPKQIDQGGGGIDPDSPDGVGDLCQNADFDGEGKVDILDVTLLRRWLVGLEPDLDPALPPSP